MFRKTPYWAHLKENNSRVLLVWPQNYHMGELTKHKVPGAPSPQDTLMRSLYLLYLKKGQHPPPTMGLTCRVPLAVFADVWSPSPVTCKLPSDSTAGILGPYPPSPPYSRTPPAPHPTPTPSRLGLLSPPPPWLSLPLIGTRAGRVKDHSLSEHQSKPQALSCTPLWSSRSGPACSVPQPPHRKVIYCFRASNTVSQ